MPAIFPEWKGNLFVGALRGGAAPPRARRRRVVGEEVLLRDLGERIRDVRRALTARCGF